MTNQSLSELVSRCRQIEGDYYLCGVRSQLKPLAWLDMLAGGTGVDPDMHFILDGVVNGFRVVNDSANIQGYMCKNYSSCCVSDNGSKLKELLEEEFSQGKLSCVRDRPRCVHAIGVIQKKEAHKIRPIIDCKRPEGKSVNNFTEGVMDRFKFLTVETVVEKIIAGKYFISTVDLSQAYRSVLIHPDNRELFGLSFEDKLMVDNFLCFGSRAAPFIFNRLTDCVCRYMRDMGVESYNYLDDIVRISESYEQGVRDQLLLIQLLRRLGFGIAWSKVCSPTQECTFLGIVIDTKQGELGLPEGRLHKLRLELSFWKGRRKATSKQLQVLVGNLVHCARIIKGGKLYMHFLFDKLKESIGKRRVKLDEKFHRDLSWWGMFAEHFNSVPLCDVNNIGVWVALSDEGNHIRVWGWEFENKMSIWFTPENVVGYKKSNDSVQVYVPGNIMGDTTSREISALWVFLMENSLICDCTLIVFCIHKGTWLCLKKNHHISDFSAMILRHIYWWSMYHNVVIKPIWKPLT